METGVNVSLGKEKSHEKHGKNSHKPSWSAKPPEEYDLVILGGDTVQPIAAWTFATGPASGARRTKQPAISKHDTDVGPCLISTVSLGN